jgi:hypothetical protein
MFGEIESSVEPLASYSAQVAGHAMFRLHKWQKAGRAFALA